MKVRSIKLIALMLALGLACAVTASAQRRSHRLTPRTRLMIAKSRTHRIKEYHVYTRRNGSQYIEMTSNYTPNVYSTPTRRRGESGNQHLQRLQKAADQMLKEAQDFARKAGITPEQ